MPTSSHFMPDEEPWKLSLISFQLLGKISMEAATTTFAILDQKKPSAKEALRKISLTKKADKPNNAPEKKTSANERVLKRKCDIKSVPITKRVKPKVNVWGKSWFSHTRASINVTMAEMAPTTGAASEASIVFRAEYRKNIEKMYETAVAKESPTTRALGQDTTPNGTITKTTKESMLI